MLEKLFDDLYAKLAISFYSRAFAQKDDVLKKLSSLEVSCLEMVYMLGRPSIGELARFMKISEPNATYRINCLIKKGYLRKVRDEQDKRKYYLEATDQFIRYSCVSDAYIAEVLRNAEKRFSAQELAQFERMLRVIIDMME